MTKHEFLEKMRHALANDLGSSTVQENVNYYDGYISEEVRKGRAEETVIEELGDPWAIARNIIEMAEGAGNVHEEYTYDSGRQVYSTGRQNQDQNHIHVFGLDSWWKKLLLILGILGVLMVVIAVIGGIFSFLAPLIMPLLIIMLIIRLIGGRRR